jgi:hypothetical protein
MAHVPSAPAPAPLWLRVLGAAVIALMAGALVYALAIGIANFSQIGV